jgi:geranylgeranyl diphosphate synthase type II
MRTSHDSAEAFRPILKVEDAGHSLRLVRLEATLKEAVSRAASGDCPPHLRDALSYAVFPGGARLRPHLCLTVAAALSERDEDDSTALAAAAAVELIHCASLVHDDLPCFDDASTRRGKPSVHRVFGEPVALLAGDALIVLAFETLGMALRAHTLIPELARAAGAARGIIGGQAWESEEYVQLDAYHRAKTASLFEASAALGALSVGAPADGWRDLGVALGRAYQAADDVADAVGGEMTAGKPTGVDAALGRPSAVRTAGVDGARRQVRELLTDAVHLIPPCPRQSIVRAFVDTVASRIGA